VATDGVVDWLLCQCLASGHHADNPDRHCGRSQTKKCKTLRLPGGERYASCGRVPRVISPYSDIYVGRGWVIGGDRYSQRKGSGY
jgi:hypothetical protein